MSCQNLNEIWTGLAEANASVADWINLFCISRSSYDKKRYGKSFNKRPPQISKHLISASTFKRRGAY